MVRRRRESRYKRAVLRPEDEPRVLEAIRREPGRSLRSISRATGVHPTAVRGHVNRLARTGQLREFRVSATRSRFYAGETAPSDLAVDHELRQAGQPQLLSWIARNPGATQLDLLAHTQSLGWSRSTTQHRLKRLVEQGLVATSRHGKYNHYVLSPDVRTPVKTEPTPDRPTSVRENS